MSGDESVAQMLVSMLGLRDGLDLIRDAVQAASVDREESLKKQAIEPAAIDPKIIVQHAVPRVMTELIRSQFRLIHPKFGNFVLIGVVLVDASVSEESAPVDYNLQYLFDM